MAVHVTFEYDDAEHLRANRAVLRRSSSRYITWSIGSVAFGVAAWQLIAGWGSVAPVKLFTNTMPSLLLGVFWLGMGPVFLRRAANSAAEHDASAWGSQERVIDGAGFHSRANGLSTDLPWNALVRGEETGEFFLFYPEKSWSYYLPKRALSPAQVDEVRSLMRSRLSGRARLLGS